MLTADFNVKIGRVKSSRRQETRSQQPSILHPFCCKWKYTLELCLFHPFWWNFQFSWTDHRYTEVCGPITRLRSRLPSLVGDFPCMVSISQVRTPKQKSLTSDQILVGVVHQMSNSTSSDLINASWARKWTWTPVSFWGWLGSPVHLLVFVQVQSLVENMPETLAPTTLYLKP